MGYDPTLDAGFLNAAQAASWPIILQPAAPSPVGIRTQTPNPAYLLDVNGTARFSDIVQTQALTATTATLNNQPLVSGTQWTIITPTSIQYTSPVTVGGTVTAQTYQNLPVATPTTKGLVQIGNGLQSQAGVLTAAIPFISCSLQGTATTFGGEYLVQVTQLYACQVSPVSTGVQASIAGNYAVTLATPNLATPLTVWKNSAFVGTLPTTATTATFVISLSTSDVVTISAQSTTGVDGILVMYGV
jgi:hypothetical protein